MGVVHLVCVIHQSLIQPAFIPPAMLLHQRQAAPLAALHRAHAIMAESSFPARGKGRGRQRPARKPRPPSFATRLQQARTTEEVLILFAEASPDQSISALHRLAMLVPREAPVLHEHADQRVVNLLESGLGTWSAEQGAQALWSLGMILEPSAELADDNACRRAAVALATSLAAHGASLDTLTAASALWGCETLGIEPPGSVRRRAEELPFRLHVRAVAPALKALSNSPLPLHALRTLSQDLPWRRDAIASGSTSPSVDRVLEDRETCWFSDSGRAFEYSGKTMLAEAPLPPPVAAVRRAEAPMNLCPVAPRTRSHSLSTVLAGP
jgi:hypothetical protein